MSYGGGVDGGQDQTDKKRARGRNFRMFQRRKPVLTTCWSDCGVDWEDLMCSGVNILLAGGLRSL